MCIRDRWTIKGAHFDWQRMVIARNKEVDRLEAAYKMNLKNSGVEIYENFAKLRGINEVELDNQKVIKAKHIMSEINGQDTGNAMVVNQDDFIDRFIDKVISDKPNCLIVKNKNNDEIGYLSTKRLSEILKR